MGTRAPRTEKTDNFLNPSYSIIREHSLHSDHCYKEDDFKILYRARNNIELRLAESVFIHKSKPGFNKNETAVTLNVFP